MDEPIKYALAVACKEVIAVTGSVMVEEGERRLVLDEPGGWVEATSTRWRGGDLLPQDAKAFASLEEAEKFARRWKGHPWYCQPNGNFEVIPVRQTYVQTPAGFAVAKGD